MSFASGACAASLPPRSITTIPSLQHVRTKQRGAIQQDAMILKNLLSMSGMNVLKSGLQFAMTVMMTHFVAPAEFGLVTFSLPFVGFIALLTDLGMSSALVQRHQLDGDDAGAAITLICSIGLVCAAALAAIAAPLAHLLSMQGLAPVLAGLSLSVVLSIAALGPRALLERELRYQTIASVEATAVIVSVFACVCGALAGWGVWALITYYILIQVVRAAAFSVLAIRNVRPNLQWRRVSSILTFGGWVLASNLLNFAGRAVGNLLIGAALGSAEVGLYGLAYQVMILPLMVITWPGSGVLMATLSRQSAAGGTLTQRNDIICGVLFLTAAVVFPAMAYCTFGADHILTTMLPTKWAAIVPLISLMSVAGAAQSISAYSGAMLLSNGAARLQFWLSSANSAATIVAFLVGLPFGLNGMVAIYLAVTLVVSALTMIISCIMTSLPIVALLKALAPATAATLVSAVVAARAIALEGPTTWSWAVASVLYILMIGLGYVLFHRQLTKNLLNLRNLSLGGKTAATA